MFKKGIEIAFVLQIAGACFAELHTIPDRVPNSTLRLPATVQSSATYSTASAFPGTTFSRPVSIVVPPGENSRLFIVEQAGRIALVSDPLSPTRSVFLDISERVNFDNSEKGLLALAFHPGYQTNRYFYVWYDTRTGQNRLSRFEIDPIDSSKALPASELIIINQTDEAPNHNGGTLLFGPDGYLYLSLGDEGHSAWLNNYQRIDRDFFSGIIRIDVDKRSGSLAPNPHPANNNNDTINYAIPADNPFVGATSFNGLSVNPANVRTEFWAVGLRNPWKMAFDSQAGLLYCADVGQSDREEVNIILKGGNYGWPYREGYLTYNGFGAPPSGFNPVPPIADYTHGSGATQGNSITGGFVYRGSAYSDLVGAYLFADYVSGNIWTLRYQSGQTNVPFTRIAGLAGVSAFGISPVTGEILLANHYQNRIDKLVRTTSGSSNLPATLAETGAFSEMATLTPHPGISPYDINVPFWSDNSKKSRWFSVPDISSHIGFNALGNWAFPSGTVWIKHFELEMRIGEPDSRRRIETRFLVKTSDGVYGVTYRWGSSTSNATLVPEEGLDETFLISEGGTNRNQVWRYPSQSECLVCHTPNSSFALGFSSSQLNRDSIYHGATENQIVALSRAGYLTGNIGDPAALPKLAPASDTSVSLEHRARSYLAANCVQCHQPGGTAQGLWDARITTSTAQAGLINGPLLDYLGDTNNRVLKPLSLTNSMLYMRVANFGPKHMPPLATSVLDTQGIAALSDWINSFRRPSPPMNLRVVPEN